VQIVNTCVLGCAASNIHFHCGWFASARMVNQEPSKGSLMMIAWSIEGKL